MPAGSRFKGRGEGKTAKNDEKLGMKITKTAWSPKRKNHFVNFYAFEPDSRGRVTVLSPQFSWKNKEDAIAQYNIERANKDSTPAYRGSVLHVILDMSSGRIYLPDKETKSIFQLNPNLQGMLDAVKIKIDQLIDIAPMAPPIRGDPLDTIRIRKLGDFKSVANFVRRQVSDYNQFTSDIKIPVVEADLSSMPKTAVQLFGSIEAASRKQYLFVAGPRTVEFVINEGVGPSETSNVIHYEKAPFILINIAPETRVSEADKERIVVLAYKEYAITNRPDMSSSRESPQLQSFKYLMYIGWSFHELCIFVLKPEDVSDFRMLMSRAAFIYNAAKSLHQDGYPDPTGVPYYYSFKIGEDFPVKFPMEASTEVYSQESSHDIFHFVYFNAKTSVVTIRTPLFLDGRLIAKIFKPKSQVFIAQYDPTEKVLKTNQNAEIFEKGEYESVRALKLDLSEKSGVNPSQVKTKQWNLIDAHFHKKHISDYPQATEIIKNLCERITAKPDIEAQNSGAQIQFDDIEVVVGPFQQRYGFLGGYVDKDKIKEKFNGSTTIEPIPGLIVTPPAILIDDSEYPSVGDRTNVIIHEYRHHINIQLSVHSVISNPADKKNKSNADRVRAMVVYLQSPDERLAHKTQFKYMLGIGMSKEQLLRHLMHGKPTINEIPLVKEYLSIINDAVKEIEAEEKEELADDQYKSIGTVDSFGIDDFYEPNE